MKPKTFILKPQTSRDFPAPQGTGQRGAKHYILVCEAKSIPSGIPLDPNPRDQNTNRMVAKEVKKSLLSPNDLCFYIKNKGITMLAAEVKAKGSNKNFFEIQCLKGHGIVDGGHTYKIIQEAQKSDEIDIPDNQFVKIEILTGIDPDYFSEIAGGLNTSMQVSDMSLENLRKHFDWIKDELKGEPYESKIIYRENAEGEVSILEIIAFLLMFLPDQDGSPQKNNPTVAYSSKSTCLKEFNKNLDRFKEMAPILRDILYLHDYIMYEAHSSYNATGGKAGLLYFMQQRTKPFHLIYTGQDVKYLMDNGVLYPILGAFRYLVTRHSDGKIGWRLGSFEKVKNFCKEILGDMMRSTQQISITRGRNINAIGKDVSHWENLYKTVQVKFLETPNK